MGVESRSYGLLSATVCLWPTPPTSNSLALLKSISSLSLVGLCLDYNHSNCEYLWWKHRISSNDQYVGLLVCQWHCWAVNCPLVLTSMLDFTPANTNCKYVHNSRSLQLCGAVTSHIKMSLAQVCNSHPAITMNRLLLIISIKKQTSVPRWNLSAVLVFLNSFEWIMICHAHGRLDFWKIKLKIWKVYYEMKLCDTKSHLHWVLPKI